MPLLATRVQPIQRDLQLLLNDLVSPERRAAELAEFARVEIEKAKDINARALGQVPPLKIFVDGTLGAPLTSVKAGGVIVVDFQLVAELLEWIDLQLILHSPMKTGRYLRSHRLFADGVQIDIDESGRIPVNVPAADQYVFINIVPYARKIERGSSTQAPDGVYEVVAHLAQQRFRGLARISFSFRTAIGGGIVGGKLGNRAQQRNPAIIVTQRR